MTLQQQARVNVNRAIAKGTTITTIAEQSDVSAKTVSRIRNGHKVSELSVLSVLNGVGVIESSKTLDATVEQLAAQCIDSDLTHVRDTDLECAKYRRVMQLEKELEQTQDVLKQREQHLKSCENALIEANEKIQNVLDESGKQLADLSLQLYGANAEIKRLTALSETHAANWKAACVQAEQLQRQLDFSARAFNKTSIERHDAKAEIKKLDEQLTEIQTIKTQQEAQIMRLRVYVWSLIAALVFVVASGLVVWGGV